MTLKTVTREVVEHQLTGRPGFENLRFTESSPDYLFYPQAVNYASDRGVVLQSAREAAVFRMEAGGADHANSYQATRTAALYFMRQGVAYVAFDDSVDDNLVIANAQKGYDANVKGRELLISLNDDGLRAALDRAEKADRISKLPAQSYLELSVQNQGQSAFGSSPLIQGILGDVSEEYASHLSGKGYRAGHLWTVSSNRVDEQSGNGKNVILRHVGLGGVGFDVVVAYDVFGGGFARGVRSQAPNSP